METVAEKRPCTVSILVIQTVASIRSYWSVTANITTTTTTTILSRTRVSWPVSVPIIQSRSLSDGRSEFLLPASWSFVSASGILILPVLLTCLFLYFFSKIYDGNYYYYYHYYYWSHSCRVFIIIYLKQTMLLGYMVCSYSIVVIEGTYNAISHQQRSVSWHWYFPKYVRRAQRVCLL